MQKHDSDNWYAKKHKNDKRNYPATTTIILSLIICCSLRNWYHFVILKGEVLKQASFASAVIALTLADCVMYLSFIVANVSYTPESTLSHGIR